MELVSNRKLASCNAKIETYSNGLDLLISYSTLVAGRTANGIIYLTKDWDCSVTTIGHVRRFTGFGSAKAIRKLIASGDIQIIENYEFSKI